jgi:quercetin dioxygenase-like cupin family protein
MSNENAEEVMDGFPAFMKNKWTLVPASQQNTKDLEGYYSEANDGSQVAFWTCHSGQVSVEHRHPFDEYMVCVSGQYTAHVEDQTFVLDPGDELYIEKGKLQWGQAKPGTRSIHVFGGRRIESVVGAGSTRGR